MNTAAGTGVFERVDVTAAGLSAAVCVALQCLIYHIAHKSLNTTSVLSFCISNCLVKDTES